MWNDINSTTFRCVVPFAPLSSPTANVRSCGHSLENGATLARPSRGVVLLRKPSSKRHCRVASRKANFAGQLSRNAHSQCCRKAHEQSETVKSLPHNISAKKGGNDMPRRSKPYITQFFQRDRLAFTAMSRVGHVTKDHLKSCGLADSRIKNYLKDGLIEKVAYKDGNKAGECYKLTRAGRELAERQWAIRGHYHAQSPLHDMSLANKYFSLPDHLRDTWRTETEIRDMFFEKLSQMREQGEEQLAKQYEDMLMKGLISMPDALYVNEQGVSVSYEVITNSYGQAELQAKEAFVAIMKTDYETTRI